MNLKELREFVQSLEGLPDETPVILQKDPEGNGYSPLDGAGGGMYLAETTWSGEMYPTDAEIGDSETRYTDEDRAPTGAVPAIVLWPVN